VFLRIANSNQADSNPAVYPTVSDGAKEIVSENIYRYTVLHYQPGVTLIQFAKEHHCSHKSPEGALISMVSAMSNLDYDVWSECWAENSRPESGQSARAQMLSAWRRAVVGKVLVLQHRIETGHYVLIEYAMKPQGGNPESNTTDAITSVVTFENVKDGWSATNDLASDPVRLFWQKPDYRPKFVVR
jgi:hypothetical protein